MGRPLLIGVVMSFEVVNMADIEAVVDGSSQVRALEKAVRRGVVSATRSDRLAAELLSRGLGPDRIAVKLGEMLEAEQVRPKQVWDSVGQTWKTEEVSSPDYKAQAMAVKFLCDIHGFLFALPKDAAVNISVNTLAIARDVEGMSPADALRELPGALRMLREIDPKVLAAAEEAEVEE